MMGPGMRPGFPPGMMGPGGPPGGPGGPGGPVPPMGPGGPDNRMLVPSSCDTSTNPTFATVKASAPNTIQYLPTRPGPQYDSRPRGPPSLDFLQRYSKPDQNNMGDPGGPPGPHMMGGPGMGMPMGSPGAMGPNGPMNPRMQMMGPRGGPPSRMRGP